MTAVGCDKRFDLAIQTHIAQGEVLLRFYSRFVAIALEKYFLRIAVLVLVGQVLPHAVFGKQRPKRGAAVPEISTKRCFGAVRIQGNKHRVGWRGYRA